MGTKDLLLPLLAALWALCTIVLTGTKELNSIRDRIMFADAEGFLATLQHRKLLAWNDWLPLQILMNAACVAFAAVSIILLILLNIGGWTFWVIAIVVAVITCGMSLALVVTGIGEWRLICQCLREPELPIARAGKGT